MAKRGLKGVKVSRKLRDKIRNSRFLQRLIERVDGHYQLTGSQLTAGLGLLRKLLPDQTMAERNSEAQQRFVARIPAPAATTEEWLAQYAPRPGTVR